MNILPKNSIKSIQGEKNLYLYQFKTKVAKHFFFKKCGINTHHFREFDQNGIGDNIFCIDKVDSFSINTDVLDNK